MRPPLVLTFLFLASFVAAQSRDGGGPQVDAARSDAIESLKRQIIASHINADLTVADLVARLRGEGELDRVLDSAEQLGGPRWLGDQAVQVRLAIDGGRISKLLLKLVRAQPKLSPISGDALQSQLKWWSDRIFSATGTSTGAGDITSLRPSLSDRAWWAVADADRRRALLAARDHAVDRVFQELGAIQLSGDQTLAPALREPAVAKPLRKWLHEQPVKDVQFNDDLTVRVTLADLAAGLWRVLHSALADQHVVPIPSTDSGWEQLHQQIVTKVGSPTGVGTVQPPPQAAATQSTLLPANPPAWSKEQAEAEATSPREGSPLHTSRRAEALALEKVRDQINRLALSPGVSVGVAAGKDPRIEQAITKSLSRARPSKVDYGSDGAVTVHVVLRLSDLWSLISGQE